MNKVTRLKNYLRVIREKELIGIIFSNPVDYRVLVKSLEFAKDANTCEARLIKQQLLAIEASINFNGLNHLFSEVK